MKVLVKTLKGQKFNIQVEETDTIGKFKSLIEAQESLSAVIIIFAGKSLKDDQTFQSANIKDDDFVICMVKKKKTKPAAPAPAPAPAPAAAPADRIADEKAEADRIAAEKAEANRIAAEKAEADRIAAEKAEADRIMICGNDMSFLDTLTKAQTVNSCYDWFNNSLQTMWSWIGLNQYTHQRAAYHVEMPKGRNFHVLLVATDNWTNDADMMANLYKEILMYPAECVHVLNKGPSGKGPTSNEVLQKFAELAKIVGPNDVFTFYYSGHGTRNNGTFSCCTKVAYLSHKAILEAVATLRVTRVLYIIDACYSGKFDTAKGKPSATFDSGDIEAFFNAGQSGTLVMAASSATQQAPNSSALSHLFLNGTCQIIQDRKRLNKKTEMCVTPLTLFDQMAELKKIMFPDAPPLRIAAAHNLASYPIGPLTEV